MKQKLREPDRKTDKSIIRTRGFDTFLPIVDRISKQKISKVIEDLDITTNQFDLLYIYIAPQPREAENVIFNCTHRLFAKKDHIWCHKVSITWIVSNYALYIL